MAKTDMERVGLFTETGYLLGNKYQPAIHDFNTASHKGKQMLPGGSKTVSALQHGYFDSKYNRIMESEAYSDPVKMRRHERLNEAKRNIGKAFVPSSGEKWPSGAGNHYGTFAGSVGAFSPVAKPRKAYTTPGKNFLTNPPKQGTGYGYVAVIIGGPFKYSSETYDQYRNLRKKEEGEHKQAMKGSAFKLNMHPKCYFDENPYKNEKGLPPIKKGAVVPRVAKPFRPSNPGKVSGGCMAGSFDPYPSHSNDPYKPKRKSATLVSKVGGKIFHPSPGPKSCPTGSIIDQNITKVINSTNLRQIQSVF